MTIPYHEFQPYGLYCVLCGADDTHPSHHRPLPTTLSATQPAPDAGEWRVEAMPTHGWRVVDATGQEIVANVYRKEDAEQIVANHNAVPKLVAALGNVKSAYLASDETVKLTELIGGLMPQIDAALAARQSGESER